jgi:nucleoside-diphosphate-sugar epimerase
MNPAPPHLNLIIGCGYLGRRVASRWLAGGRRVAALTRGNAATLAAMGVEPMAGDILDPGTLQALPRAETVLYAVGWDRASGRTRRETYVDGLGHVLDALPPGGRLIQVSSTSVYGQTDGGWVDEAGDTHPLDDSGRVILEAERLLRARRPDAIVLRFGGIYGPGRLLRTAAVRAGEPLVGDADRFLNLIHVEDGADAVLAAEARGRPGATYNIVDDEPTTRRAFYTYLAESLGAPPARFDHRLEPEAPNRRISNARAKEELAWQLNYGTYREGVKGGL